MKAASVDNPMPSDGAAKEDTGKTMRAGFQELDGLGGPQKGRRELVDHVYAATGKDEWWATSIVVEYEKAVDTRADRSSRGGFPRRTRRRPSRTDRDGRRTATGHLRAVVHARQGWAASPRRARSSAATRR
jgi:hypothetical protein